MTKGSTLAEGVRAAAVLAIAGVFVVVGVASGLWIHLAILAVTFGIYYATVTLKKSEKPLGGDGARVISLADYGIDSVKDLDEVA
jgi:hypothetical protein